jgi:hypothetical protein
MTREKAWAVAIARNVATAIPEAVKEVPDLRLTDAQIAALQKAFQRRLIQTMGEDDDEPAK